MTDPDWRKPTRFVASFHAAGQGFLHAAKTQRNFRIHIAITVAILGVGAFLRLSVFEWGLIVFAIGMVLHAELFNTAMEAIVDRVSPEQHPLARIAKDTAAAAVLVAVVAAVIVGLLVLLPKLAGFVMTK